MASEAPLERKYSRWQSFTADKLSIMTKTIGLLSLTVLILLLITGCGDKSSRSTDIDPLFQDFLNEIPKKSLPINLSCGLPNELKSSDDLGKYKSFIPKLADQVFGTIDTSSDSYRLIVYGYTGDDIYPVLFSFDTRGQIIDSLKLILTPCGAADDTVIPHSFVTIDNGLTIKLTDTTRLIHFPGHWKKLDAEDESMPDSLFETTGDYIVDSVRISNADFKISKEGRFVKQ